MYFLTVAFVCSLLNLSTHFLPYISPENILTPYMFVLCTKAKWIVICTYVNRYLNCRRPSSAGAGHLLMQFVLLCKHG